MKGKQLALLLVLALVLGGLGWFLQTKTQSSWEKSASGAGGKVLNLPLNDVAQITIKGPETEVNLGKKDDVWVVKDRADYPAEFSEVSELLRTAWELKTLQDVKVGPSQMARLELGEPGKGPGSATLVDFKDKDGKRLEGLLLGKVLRGEPNPEMAQFGQSEGAPRGRYVKPAADGAKVSLVSEIFTRAEAKPERWLQTAFIKIENLVAVSVAGPDGAAKWKLTRENPSAEWKLEGATAEEKVDASKVSSLNFTYSNPSFSDVLAPSAKPEETGLDKPTVATLTTSEGFTYTLKIGKARGEDYPLTLSVAANLPKERTPAPDEKPEDKTKLDQEFKDKLKKQEEKLAIEKKFEQAIYVVAKSTVEPLLKDRAALLAEKKAETPGTPPAPGAGAAAPAPSAPPAPKPIEAVTPPVSIPPAPAAPPTPPPPAEKPAAGKPAAGTAEPAKKP